MLDLRHSVFDRLGYSKKSIQGKSKDLSLFDNFDASDTLSKLQNLETQVAEGSITWQDYFSNLKDGAKWQVEFVQNNDLSCSTKILGRRFKLYDKRFRNRATSYRGTRQTITRI